MQYLWALIICVGIWALTTILTGFLGLLIPIVYMLLGFMFGTESLILGIGGLLGNLINIFNVNRYIKTEGALSHAPMYSKIASICFIVVFLVTILFKYAFNIELKNINYWYLIIIAIVAWIILSNILRDRKTKLLSDFSKSVVKYKIIKKYDNDPKWATYLYFNNSEEGWNQTIPGSFLAKDPEKDLTFVHNTKEDALNYAKRIFENAKFIDDYTDNQAYQTIESDYKNQNDYLNNEFPSIDNYVKQEVLNDLFIVATIKSPMINFSTNGILLIEGKSIMEDAKAFYYKLYEWMEEYCKNPAKKTEVNINLELINGDSINYLLRLLRKITEINVPKHKLLINWKYDAEDEFSKEQIVNFSQLLSTPIKAIPNN